MERESKVIQMKMWKEKVSKRCNIEDVEYRREV